MMYRKPLRILLGGAITILVLLLLAPVIFYGYALSLIEGRPVPQASSRSESELMEMLPAKRRKKVEDMVALNPYTYLSTMVCIISRDVNSEKHVCYREASIIFADQVSQSYLARGYTEDEPSEQAKRCWTPCVMALTIWVTRHWSRVEILNAVVQRDQPARRGSENVK